MPKSLILFTSCYPYGTGETFLEAEIDFLANSFERIIIVTPDVTSASCRVVPTNVTIVRKHFDLTKREKYKSIFGIFSKLFFHEWKTIGSRGRLFRKINLSYFLISAYKGQKIALFIENLLKNESISARNVCLYSYWWLDEAIGIGFFKKQHPEALTFTRCHGYDLYEERTSGNYLPLKKFTVKTMDRVFPISEDGRKYIQNHYLSSDVNLDKVIVARLGVNDGKISTMNSGSKDRIFTIVTCSLIYPNKRLELLIAALNKLDFHIHWTHFGSYVKGFSELYHQEIMQQISLLDKERIHVDFKGHVSNADVLAFYNLHEIDLFINLSKSEGIPVSIMEAMSFSIPVLATNVGGTSEIVNNENGILVEESVTIDILADEMRTFHSLSLEEINTKREKAYSTFHLMYNAEVNYKDFIQIIDKISLKHD